LARSCDRNLHYGVVDWLPLMHFLRRALTRALKALVLFRIRFIVRAGGLASERCIDSRSTGLLSVLILQDDSIKYLAILLKRKD
jgi:hypothetical protein